MANYLTIDEILASTNLMVISGSNTDDGSYTITTDMA